MPVREMDKVWNTSENEYKEEFNGKLISLPPNGGPNKEGTYVVMSRRDRVKFMGTYRPFNQDLKNQRDEDEGAKALKWCVHSEAELMVEGHRCNVCGLRFNTPQELAGHVVVHEGQPVAPEPGEIANDTGTGVGINKIPT